MATIDELTVEVNTESKQVNDGIDALSKSLLKLKKSVKGLENIKLDGFKNSMKSISDSAKSLRGIKDLAETAKALKSMSGVSSAAKSLGQVKKSADGLKDIKLDIDTKDFDSAVRELQERFKDVGTDFSFSGSFVETEKEARRLEKTLSKLYERQDEMRDLDVNVEGNGFIKLQRNIALTSNKLDVLRNQMEKAKKANGELSKSLTIQRHDAQITQSAPEAPKTKMISANSMGYDKSAMRAAFGEGAEGIRSFDDALKKLGNDAASVLNNVKTNFSGIKESVKSATESVSGVGDKLKNGFKDAKLSADEFENYLENLQIPEIRTDNLKKLQSEFERTERKLDELTVKSDNWAAKGVNPDGAKFRNLQEQIVATSKKADALRAKMKEVGNITPEGLSKWQKFGKASSVASQAFGAIKKAASGTIDSVKKISDAFSSLLSVIKKVSSAVGKMFSGMASVTPKVLSAITAPIKGITSAVSKLKGAGSEVHSISSGFSRLASAAAGLAAAGGIARFGKNAIELGSDIAEVENVVDTAFGAMADKAYDFASKATKQFGLSELAAKQYSGTMMSMLRSSNIAQKEAANMSIALTGLAGDIASFYNIETDEAFYKLRSAMSGETEAIKQLGINMNIANLEAYALANGITKSYREMTIAEQTAIRYNYIMDKSRHIQGDYAKTANTFANQLRLLKLNLQSIAAVIGQGLIAAILPAIKMLNKLMEKLMQAAKVFRDFMYVLFGKKIEAPARGIVDDMAGISDYTADMSSIGDSADDMADGMENTADGMDDATSSAKKLKKALSVLPIDQLNQLTGNLDYGTSKNKGTGKGKDKNKDSKLDDLGIGDMSGMFDDLYDKKEIEPINKWAEAIRKAFLEHDWEGLGKTIALMTNKGLRKIYDGIKKITPKVEIGRAHV